MKKRPLREIARDIREHWKNVWFGAMPYLEAMETLNSIDDDYYDDSAKDIINRFLCNAQYWRGTDARRIKNELKSML